MRIYISGPISNDDQKKMGSNIDEFFHAEMLLVKAGYIVANPVINGIGRDAPWLTHMKADIKMMMDCDAVALLPGFKESKGAMVEVTLARGLGMEVKTIEEWCNK